jgi:GntR family transcriptional regulator
MALLAFHLDDRSGVPYYVQLIEQVRHAVRFGMLRTGDQLPTVKEVAAMVPVNPNTVLHAYRELEHDGLVRIQAGRGTFVAPGAGPVLARDVYDSLARRLEEWVGGARDVGLDEAAMESLFDEVVRQLSRRESA